MASQVARFGVEREIHQAESDGFYAGRPDASWSKAAKQKKADKGGVKRNMLSKLGYSSVQGATGPLIFFVPVFLFKWCKGGCDSRRSNSTSSVEAQQIVEWLEGSTVLKPLKPP